MPLIIAILLMLGALAAMDRTRGPMRRKMAWATIGAGLAVVAMLAVAPPEIWVR